MKIRIGQFHMYYNNSTPSAHNASMMRICMRHKESCLLKTMIWLSVLRLGIFL